MNLQLLRAVVASLAVLLTVSIPMATPARAEVLPGDGESMQILTSQQMGGGNSITVFRPGGQTILDVVVPPGMTLTSYQATAVVPAGLRVDISLLLNGDLVEQRTLAEGRTDLLVDLPDQTESGELTVVAQELSNGACASGDVESVALRLDDNRFGYLTGEWAPASIGDFFPPVLEQLEIVSNGDPALRSAHYEVAAAMARRYGVIPRFSVVTDPTLSPAISSDPFHRTLWLVEAAVPQLRLVSTETGSYLELAGPLDQLPALAGSLSDPAMELLLVDEVVASALLAEPAAAGGLERRSLADAGVRRLEVSGTRVLELVVPLPQSLFGEPVENIGLRLTGLSVARGSSSGMPTVTVEINGELDRVVEVDDRGFFDIEVEIGAGAMQSVNTVVLRSELLLGCGEVLPVHELRLAGDSTVEATAGQVLPPSVQRFAQVSLDGLLVASGDTPAELEATLTLLSSLQQASANVPLSPRAALPQDVVAGEAIGLVVTNGSGPAAAATAAVLTTVSGERASFELDETPDSLVLSSMGTTDLGADLLVVRLPETTGVQASLVETLRDEGWSALRDTGTVVQSELALDLPMVSGVDDVTEPATESSPLRMFLFGVVGVTGAGVIVLSLRHLWGRLRTG